MHLYTSPKTGIDVVEAQNGFYLYLGNRCSGIGDGVNLFDGVDIGTTEFYLGLEDLADDPESLDAYFPLLEQYDIEHLVRDAGYSPNDTFGCALVDFLWPRIEDKEPRLRANQYEVVVSAIEDLREYFAENVVEDLMEAWRKYE